LLIKTLQHCLRGFVLLERNFRPMKHLLYLCLSSLVLISCKEKKEEKDAVKFFPVVSFLKGQAKEVDTSLFRIVKLETVDTVTTQSYVRREDFKHLAKDFLELPDITSSKWKDDYQETQMFDETLNNMILTYTTKEPENPVQREDVLLAPTNEKGNNDVNSIVVHTVENKGDSTVEKNMVWYVNKRFTVVTKVQRKNQPERARKLEVIWNDFQENRN
jgi:hypothetical protein